VLQITRLDQFWPVFDSTEAALAALHNPTA
jgi:hypothetical protein